MHITSLAVILLVGKFAKERIATKEVTGELCPCER